MRILCLSCPVGCDMEVCAESGAVSYNECPAGIKFAQEELRSPMRNITTSVRLDTGQMCSVKTARPVPKHMIFDILRGIHALRISSPVRMGDVLADVCGHSIVATRSEGEAR